MIWGKKECGLRGKKVFYRQGILQGKVRQNLRKVFGKVSEKVTNLCTEAATRFRWGIFMQMNILAILVLEATQKSSLEATQ